MSDIQEKDIGWWNRSGLAAAATAGVAEMDRRDMNILIYDVPRHNATVVIARGQRAEDVRDRVADLFTDAA